MVDAGAPEPSIDLPLITLSAGSLDLVLSPATGGSIARFTFRDGERAVPILRGCEGAPDHVLSAASCRQAASASGPSGQCGATSTS